jgi:hypothetical protein
MVGAGPCARPPERYDTEVIPYERIGLYLVAEVARSRKDHHQP